LPDVGLKPGGLAQHLIDTLSMGVSISTVKPGNLKDKI
jgi:hypothetical protein